MGAIAKEAYAHFVRRLSGYTETILEAVSRVGEGTEVKLSGVITNRQITRHLNFKAQYLAFSI